MNLRRLLDKGIETEEPWAKHRKLTFLAPVSSLDPEASGVVVLVRDVRDMHPFADAIRHRSAQREFLAIVGGKPNRRKWTCCLKLRPDVRNPGRYITHTRLGQPAETDFEVIGHGDGMALVLAIPRTDQPHQIRAHLAAHDIPIVGDVTYGFGTHHPPRPGRRIHSSHAPPRRGVPGLALRAIRVAFETPISRAPIEITAPFDDFLATLGFEPEG